MIDSYVANRYEKGTVQQVDETVAEEYALSVQYDGYDHAFLCSPEDLEELAVGHLKTMGMISHIDDIADITFEKDHTRVTIRRADNASPKHEQTVPRVTMRSDNIMSLAPYAMAHSPLFAKTAAFHYAFIFDKNATPLQSACDIGRFNAIDKAVGICLRKGLALEGTVLFTTGRIMTLTVRKARNCGIAIIVSKAPPTLQAIESARDAGISIIGFARGDRYTVYTEE
ncbi:MAG TPA: hypothetical protein ENN11_04190 [Methanomicrobia archaeon]|nr:hypothetical protein [Methanomicrobia archaeon]